MTCDACDRANVKPSTGRFNRGCRECDARALAVCPAFFKSVGSEAVTPAYRELLALVFGAEWKAGHARVKAWAEKINDGNKSDNKPKKESA